MNKRDLKLDKYGISGKRYKELCGFCEQYPEWQNELKEKTNTVHSIEITDMPIYHGNADVTANLATRRTELPTPGDNQDWSFFRGLVWGISRDPDGSGFLLYIVTGKQIGRAHV